MRIWTRESGTADWRPWRDALSALEWVAGSWDGVVLLVSDAPDDELPRLLATARLVRRFSGRATVVAGSRHPANIWIEALRAAGVEQVWRLDTRDWPGAERHPEERVEVLAEPVCPALHTRTEDGATASVCGRRGDRLVLPRRQLARHCLHDHASCPYWSGSGPGDRAGADRDITAGDVPGGGFPGRGFSDGAFSGPDLADGAFGGQDRGGRDRADRNSGSR